MNSSPTPTALVALLCALMPGLSPAATPAPTATTTTSSAPAGGEDMGEVAKKLNNPAASLISIPLQSNFDFGAGPDGDGFQYKLNVQPVIPIALSEDWKIISRTILPFVYQEDVVGHTSQEGLGDMSMTLWIAPAGDRPGKPVIGLGPVIQFPTASDDLLGSEKWGVGPSVIFVHQSKGLTAGALASHLWSVAGNSDRQDLSVTSLQPFISYTTPRHTTFGINSEANYDWENEQWTLPLNVFITQLVKIGKMPVSFQLGARYYAEAPEQGPEWGLRFSVTLVLPE
ncbi:MAG: transporter [Verrucomicrobium sp.]|nr:transporter [Verrucomicrobium sp.]